MISIIATLTAIILPNLMGARERARDAKKKQDLAAVKNALRMLYNDTQNYPAVSSAEIKGTLAVNYLPNAASIEFEYASVNNGDGFQICVPMEAGAGEDVAASRNNCVFGATVCGLSLADAETAKLFVVCGW